MDVMNKFGNNFSVSLRLKIVTFSLQTGNKLNQIITLGQMNIVLVI